MDAAERAANATMKALDKRMGEIYSAALKKAIKDNATFLQKIKDIDDGKIKPNPFYNTPAKIAKWRAGFTREAIRQDGVIDKITARLKQAGIDVKPEILKARTSVYSTNRAYTIKALGRKSGTNIAFNQYDKRQIDILMRESETPFSKIAYKSLGNNPAVVRRLTSEMAQATINGESQVDIIKRIRAVTGQSQYQAQRVAQTERTRVQSQARYDVGTEAEKLGLKITKTWSARMVNTRDTHAALDGVTIPQDEAFSNGLMYPGDPSGDASEVCNCHCVLITDVGV